MSLSSSDNSESDLHTFSNAERSGRTFSVIGVATHIIRTSEFSTAFSMLGVVWNFFLSVKFSKKF